MNITNDLKVAVDLKPVDAIIKGVLDELHPEIYGTLWDSFYDHGDGCIAQFPYVLFDGREHKDSYGPLYFLFGIEKCRGDIFYHATYSQVKVREYRYEHDVFYECLTDCKTCRLITDIPMEDLCPMRMKSDE